MNLTLVLTWGFILQIRTVQVQHLGYGRDSSVVGIPTYVYVLIAKQFVFRGDVLLQPAGLGWPVGLNLLISDPARTFHDASDRRHGGAQ